MKTTVLLVDDHTLVRSGIRLLLDSSSEVEVVGEFSSGRETLAACAELRPNLVLTDVDMPDLSGVELARMICAAHPATSVIMVSMHDGKQYVRESLRAGAKGYVLKEAALSELLDAIRAVVAGKRFVSPVFEELLVNEELTSDQANPELDLLSPREREVLQLLCEGHTSKEMHATLHISERTIDTHRWNIMKKLNIHSMAALTRFAIVHGLTSTNYQSGREGVNSSKPG